MAASICPNCRTPMNSEFGRLVCPRCGEVLPGEFPQVPRARAGQHRARPGQGVPPFVIVLLVLMVAGSLFLTLIKARLASRARQRNSLAGWEGRVAPDWTARTLDGEEVSLSDYRGQRVIVDFWATWCPPCVREIPHFQRLRQQYPEEDLVIVGLSAEDPNLLREFVRRNNVNYTIGTPTDLPAPYAEIRAIPTTFFVNRAGVIDKVLEGYHSFEKLEDLAGGG